MFRAFLIAVLGAYASVSSASAATPRNVDYLGTISLSVDATDIDRRIYKIRERIPVRNGPVTLYYPQWLPGTHSPHQRVEGLAGLVVRADDENGPRLDWARDARNVHAFHVNVPRGVSWIDLEFQFTPASDMRGGALMTPDIVGVLWSTVVLYPAEYDVSRIRVQASLTVPDGWAVATVLDQARRDGATALFRETSLETLVDSPVYAGRNHEVVTLQEGDAPVRLNIFTDAPEELRMTSAQVDAHRKLVSEASALFGSRHYDRYEFLMAISDSFTYTGLEHQRSSENSVPRGYFTNWNNTAVYRGITPHELVHSWNGKFRRPADLWTPDFNTPMEDTLLWVYEGLTEYWTKVLSARSGLWSREAALDAIAADVAVLKERSRGREWRTLQDTTHQPIIAQRRPLAFESWQRGEDYYREGALLWLEVDARLRELSNNSRSLDDFARTFFGVNGGSTVPLTYTFDDVVAALNAIYPWDWSRMLRERLEAHSSAAALDGIEGAGWKLVFDDKPNVFLDRKLGPERVDFSYSLGFSLDRDGKVIEVVWGGTGFSAGLATEMKVLGVNGRTFKPEYLQEAIRHAQAQGAPIELLVSTFDRYRTVKLEYRGGLRYPHLERIEGRADLLSDILEPRT